MTCVYLVIIIVALLLWITLNICKDYFHIYLNVKKSFIFYHFLKTYLKNGFYKLIWGLFTLNTKRYYTLFLWFFSRAQIKLKLQNMWNLSIKYYIEFFYYFYFNVRKPYLKQGQRDFLEIMFNDRKQVDHKIA